MLWYISILFYGSVTHRGLSSLGTYVVRNEKIKLKQAFEKSITMAHNRAKLRLVLKGKLNQGINLEEAIGECNKICKPESINVIRSQRRKLTQLTFEFNHSKKECSVNIYFFCICSLLFCFGFNLTNMIW